MPQSTLAAIIVSGASGLFDFDTPKAAWNMEEELRKKRAFWIYLSAFLGTIVVGVVQGILFPIVISLFMLVVDATDVKVKRLGRLPRTRVWKDCDEWKTAKSKLEEGILVLRIYGALSFANADTFSDVLQKESCAARKESEELVEDYQARPISGGFKPMPLT